VDGHCRRHGAALASGGAHGRRRGAGDDPAHAQRVLGADGHLDHGRPGGGHALTLVFVPALYAAWFRVRRDSAAQVPAAASLAANA
jgi:hypothetical protein